MQYLKIENLGVAPTECFTYLGCSTSRFSGNEDVTGQFGSGLKHAVNILLAQGYKFSIFCGKTRLEFFLEDMSVDDGFTAHTFRKVMCRIGNKVPKDLGWTLDHGSLDWTDVSMACREFVSNALDRKTKEAAEGRFNIGLVEENQVRAKDGYTRVFIGFESDVITFYTQLEKRFLNTKNMTPLGVMSKTNRNVVGQGAMLYRKGVLVKETSSNMRSIFDYNMGDELRIDECRNANEYDLLYGATINLLCRSTLPQKEAFLKELITEGNQLWELGLSKYSAQNIIDWNWSAVEPYMAQWLEAWKNVISDHILLTDMEIPKQILMLKGLTAVICPSPGWMVLANKLRFKTCYNSLSVEEQEGKEYYPPTMETIEAHYTVWGWIKQKSLHNDKHIPQLKMFTEPVTKKLGYYIPGRDIIYVNKELEGCEKRLMVVILEEMVHYVTGYEDYCLEMQQFLFNIITDQIIESVKSEYV